MDYSWIQLYPKTPALRVFSGCSTRIYLFDRVVRIHREGFIVSIHSTVSPKVGSCQTGIQHDTRDKTKYTSLKLHRRNCSRSLFLYCFKFLTLRYRISSSCQVIVTLGCVSREPSKVCQRFFMNRTPKKHGYLD